MTNEPGRTGSAARKWLLGAAFAGAFLTGGVVFSGVTLAAEGMGQGMMAGHMHDHAMMQEHLDKALTAVDATADQKARIHDILKGAMQSMAPLHQQMGGLHADLHRLLLGPTVDRAGLEKLRAEHMAEFDQASRTLVAAMADAAEVLTPDQRAKLAAMMAKDHHD